MNHDHHPPPPTPPRWFSRAKAECCSLGILANQTSTSRPGTCSQPPSSGLSHCEEENQIELLFSRLISRHEKKFPSSLFKIREEKKKTMIPWSSLTQFGDTCMRHAANTHQICETRLLPPEICMCYCKLQAAHARYKKRKANSSAGVRILKLQTFSFLILEFFSCVSMLDDDEHMRESTKSNIHILCPVP